MTELQEFIDKLNDLVVRIIDGQNRTATHCMHIYDRRDRGVWLANHNAELELAARACERAARLFRAAKKRRDPQTPETLLEMTLEQSDDE